MKVIVRGRGQGKTTELIKLSAQKQIPIVCRSKSECYIIQERAKQSGFNIPEPLTDYEMNGYKQNVLIDNADCLLKKILGCSKIDAIAVTDDDQIEDSFFGDIVKSLKEDAQKLNDGLMGQIRQGLERCYIPAIKALKCTLELINAYDWHWTYSKYEASAPDGSNKHYEFAIWEQDSQGNIRNHERYELKSLEPLK